MAQRHGARTGYRVVGIHHQGDVPLAACAPRLKAAADLRQRESCGSETSKVHGVIVSGPAGGHDNELELCGDSCHNAVKVAIWQSNFPLIPMAKSTFGFEDLYRRLKISAIQGTVSSRVLIDAVELFFPSGRHP